MEKSKSSVISISDRVLDPNFHLSEDLTLPLSDGWHSLLLSDEACRSKCGVLSLCTSGECLITINLREYRICRNDFIFISPGSIVQLTQKSDDLNVLSICFSIEFIDNINFKPIVPFYSVVIEKPRILLTDEEAIAYRSFFTSIQQLCNRSNHRYNEEVVQHLLMAFLYEVGNFYDRCSPVGEENPKRNEKLIHDLIRLILKNYKEQRSVGFYAQELCITPKYLSTIVKRVTGKTVSEWIDEAVIFEAKVQLKSTSMTVQQISDYLNFPNPSFFGRYFKRHTQVTPRVYKQR